MKVILTSLALVIACGSALAAQNNLAQTCAAEIRQYCRTIPVVGHASCLQGVSANLSAACRTAVSQIAPVQPPQANTSGVGSTPPTGGGRANTQGDGY